MENTRIYALPEEPPPAYMAAFGPESIEAVACIAAGYIGVALDPEILPEFTDR